jgi:hypothetical protein
VGVLVVALVVEPGEVLEEVLVGALVVVEVLEEAKVEGSEVV